MGVVGMKPSREYIEASPGRTVVVRHHLTQRFEFNWHHHPEFELTLIVRGRGTRLIGDSFDEFGPGDLVLLGPNLPHTWMSGPSRPPTVEAYFAHFNREDLGSWHETSALDQLLTRCRRGTAFGKDLIEPREMLRDATKEGSALRHMICFMSALDALAADAASGAPITSAGYEMSARPSRASSPLVETRLETVHAMITDSYPHEFDFSFVADRVGMSDAGFSRFFKHATGRTFTTYVQEVRIAEACRLLTETELTVSYIAHESGFGSLTQFNKVFRIHKNRTPSQWRQALR